MISHNANPESMKKSLDVLGDMHGKNRIFIAGEMGELGKQEEKISMLRFVNML
ncbi:MAG: hypothetical protein Ct9H300mP20_14960 [Gammaproteobacteria bacterium]|nr:MAG: hypothetical protein Ct9H300mP20_14960 [Gammaproteobacteria bacterium]